jgi:hypothetical protein
MIAKRKHPLSKDYVKDELANALGIKEDAEAEDDERKIPAGVDLDADGNVEVNESEETKHHGMRR